MKPGPTETLEGCGDCDPCIGGRPDQCAVGPIILQKMSVEFCNYCGFFHPDANTCGPKPLEEKEFIARLVEAGWTQAQAEQQWQSIQEDKESGY